MLFFIALFRVLKNAINLTMYNNLLNKLVLISSLVLWLSACTDSGPYIFKTDEFDRDALGFGTELTSRSKVEICYNKWSTTPKILTQMAKDECGRFGKVARFISSRDLACSIGSPAQAIFWCLCPRETLEGRLKQNMKPPQKDKNYTCSKP